MGLQKIKEDKENLLKEKEEKEQNDFQEKKENKEKEEKLLEEQKKKESRLLKLEEKLGKLMEEGECALCLQVMEDPIQIPCGHTFCQLCLDDYVLSERNDAKCPECRTVFAEFENYSINFALKNLIECL